MNFKDVMKDDCDSIEEDENLPAQCHSLAIPAKKRESQKTEKPVEDKRKT